MKKLFLVAALLFACFPTAVLPQSFSFTADTLAGRGKPGDLIILDGLIKNLSTEELHIRVIRMQNNLPAGWSTSLCSGDLCFPPFLDFYTIPDSSLGIPPLAPGETSVFHLNFNTDPNQPGSAAVPIRVENMKKNTEFSELIFSASTEPPVLTEFPPQKPADFALLANYPNPFNPATTIPFKIGGARPLRVEVNIYNLLGRKVIALGNGILPPGQHKLKWNGRDGTGQPMPSGIYFYQLRAGEFQQTRAMLLLR